MNKDHHEEELEKAYEQLVELWKKELESKEISKLDIKLLKGISNLFDFVEKSQEKKNNIEDEIKQATKRILNELIQDLLHLRLNKLFHLAMSELPSKEYDKFFPIEKIILEQFRNMSKKYLEMILEGDIGILSLESIMDIKTDLETKPDPDLKISIFKINLEGLIDIKGNIFKKIEAGDILSIHKDNIEVLKKHGLLDIIEFR